uniref:Uncharacterized protein n=1 Tax=Lactuca sativa TaxID=4236 RepID=A0A9R1XEN4_LACSA|nr:hypothetical protein LSAT_V11C400179210 [Lactuca sativa]
MGSGSVTRDYGTSRWTRRVWEMTRRVGLEIWHESRSNSATHMGVIDELEEQLGESVEDCLGLGESVLGLGKSGRGTITFSG